MAQECASGKNCRSDALLIRQEVERCRKVIEKLGMAHRSPEKSLVPI